MITRRFQNTLTEIEGLIKDDFWSAPCPLSGSALQNRRALVAVSGGVDSMCLAQMYLDARGYDGFAIAHCNFGLRGEESDADEALVREWAQSRGICLHVQSFDTGSYAERNGLSIEMAARELRYRWFAGLCRDFGYAYVAVAHHADDNAETLFLNLVRGTGMKGISGMKAVSQIPYACESDGFRLVRPLLGFTRKQIEGYAYGHSVPFREDRTNSSVEYRRNSIRHEIFPVLKKMNPSFVATINREMSYFAEAEDIVSQWCRAASGKVVRSEGPEELVIDTAMLLADAHWKYLLYHLLEPYGFTSPVLESLENLLSSGRTFSGKRFVCGESVLLTERDCLRISPSQLLEEECESSVTVTDAGLYRLGNIGFAVEICPWSEGMSRRQPEGVLAFDADKLTFPFVCRKWKRGDWMVPFGMRGKKKISDIFADMKWHQAQKKDAVIIAVAEDSESSESRVAGLLGVRMDDAYRISDSTTVIVRIRKQ